MNRCIIQISVDADLLLNCLRGLETIASGTTAIPEDSRVVGISIDQLNIKLLVEHESLKPVPFGNVLETLPVYLPRKGR